MLKILVCIRRCKNVYLKALYLLDEYLYAICIVLVYCAIIFFKQGEASEFKAADSEHKGARKSVEEEVKMQCSFTVICYVFL